MAEAGLLGARSGAKAVQAAKLAVEQELAALRAEADGLRGQVSAEKARLQATEVAHADSAGVYAQQKEQWAVLEAELEQERCASRELLAAQEALESSVSEHQQRRAEAEAEAARHKEERAKAAEEKTAADAAAAAAADAKAAEEKTAADAAVAAAAADAKTAEKTTADAITVDAVPLFRAAQDALPAARPRAGRVPRRIWHVRRTVRAVDADPDGQGRADPSAIVRPRILGAGGEF